MSNEILFIFILVIYFHIFGNVIFYFHLKHSSYFTHIQNFGADVLKDLLELHSKILPGVTMLHTIPLQSRHQFKTQTRVK